MKTTKLKSPCPKCGGLNTTLHGLNKSGSQKIGCKDCGTQRVLPKTPLSSICCTHCKKTGVDYRKPVGLCKNCYFQKKRDLNKIKTFLITELIDNPDLIPPKSFNLQEFIDYLYIVIFRKGNKMLTQNKIVLELSNYQKLVKQYDKYQEIKT